MTVSRIGLFAILAFALMVIVGSQYVSAQGLSNGTIATFDQPVVIPGHVLPAGTYEFVQSGTVVKVWDRQLNRLVANLITNAVEQPEFAERQEFEFQSRESDKALELKAWFHGSETLGHEFIYNQKNAPSASE